MSRLYFSRAPFSENGVLMMLYDVFYFLYIYIWFFVAFLKQNCVLKVMLIAWQIWNIWNFLWGGHTQALLRTVLFSAHNSSAVIFAFVIDAACVSRDFFPSEMNENGDWFGVPSSLCFVLSWGSMNGVWIFFPVKAFWAPAKQLNKGKWSLLYRPCLTDHWSGFEKTTDN